MLPEGPLELPSAQNPVVLYADGVCRPCQRLDDVAVFPGSFNPLHDGHRQLQQLAQQQFGRPVVYEISLANVDKHTIDEAAVRARLRQFESAPVVVTDQPRFVEKGRLFPGCPFVVGLDTALRIVDPRFYGDSLPQRDLALRQLLEGGHRFLVGGRLISQEGKERFGGAADLPVSAAFAPLFEVLPESRFRVDLSSTQLRSCSVIDDQQSPENA